MKLPVTCNDAGVYDADGRIVCYCKNEHTSEIVEALNRGLGKDSSPKSQLHSWTAVHLGVFGIVFQCTHCGETKLVRDGDLHP